MRPGPRPAVPLVPYFSRLGLLVTLIGCTGCTNVIVPPEAPHRPRSVFVLDHGRHASLVLPAGRDSLVRYSYGDWKYYALRQTGPSETTGAVLWPTRAAFGRRELGGDATATAVRSAVRVGIERLYEVTVDSAAIERLRTALDTLFRSQIDSKIYNRAYDLEFVHHPHDYTIIRNSNKVVALWLRRLDCRVRGPLLFSQWRVESRR